MFSSQNISPFAVFRLSLHLFYIHIPLNCRQRVVPQSFKGISYTHQDLTVTEFRTALKTLFLYFTCKVEQSLVFIFIQGLGGSMSQVVGLPNNSFMPITNTACVFVQLCKLQKGALYSQPQVIKFTSYMPMVGGSLRILRLLPPLKLVAMIQLKYCCIQR